MFWNPDQSCLLMNSSILCAHGEARPEVPTGQGWIGLKIVGLYGRGGQSPFVPTISCKPRVWNTPRLDSSIYYWALVPSLSP